jgi:hypothetical protein
LPRVVADPKNVGNVHVLDIESSFTGLQKCAIIRRSYK